MRARAALVAMLLLVPVIADAQRLRIPFGRRPGRAAPLPPVAPEVARVMQYRRLPVSMESYPLISYFQTPGLAGGAPSESWAAGGVGTRIDYRVMKRLSATFDQTNSFLGGPAFTQTFELGARLRPDRSDRRLYPFMDVRAGYIRSMFGSGRVFDYDPSTSAMDFGYAGRYASGFGAVGGAGLEFAVSNMVSITTVASMMRSQVKARDFQDGSVPASTGAYPMNSYRYSIGLRFNPVRYFTVPGTEPRGVR